MFERRAILTLRSHGPISQCVDAIENADGDLLTAGRASSIAGRGLFGRHTLFAFAMAVEVVFSFLGEEFNGAFPDVRIARLPRLPDAIVRKLSLEHIGFPHELGRRMCIGV